MLAQRSFRLCLFGPTTVKWTVQGRMPKLSLSPCFASLVVQETGETFFRYDAATGFDPTHEMVTIFSEGEIVTTSAEITVVYTVRIPSDASALADSLTFRITSPIFSLSPVIDGIDQRCLQTEEPPVISVSGADILSRRDQQWMARVIRDLYLSAEPVQKFFDALIPPVDNLGVWGPNVTEYSGVAIAVQGSTMMVFKIGTTHPIQLSGQALQFLAGPVQMGGIGSIQIYGDVATTIAVKMTNMNAGFIDRYILCGHSLGGASLCVLAAWIKAKNPDVAVEVLTFGCPRPGDQRLFDALLPLRVVKIENDGDPVVFFPPRPTEMNAIAIVFLNQLYGALWTPNLEAFIQNQGRLLLLADGTILPGGRTAPPVDLLTEFMLWAIGLGGLPTFSAHDMDEYVKRLDS